MAFKECTSAACMKVLAIYPPIINANLSIVDVLRELRKTDSFTLNPLFLSFVHAWIRGYLLSANRDYENSD